ncbi:2-deoxystreptamine glucosyltransferase [Bythopirellula polymerisocia]|uniref:2-deoxystreptamine glucosyltransferase n=2 Tax=Bythopirellula polymerisocia TaxID=2528003 RepID=A0A5C6CHH0_9BACT|nr:2-deoxystreptamine glucosyltransferase [Bythopirellula polymerisocia]
MGEDLVLVPIYTPLRTDEVNVSQSRVFFGGINVYLQQKWSWFRSSPRWFDKLLDHPALLGAISQLSGSVDPSQLGDLTVSMLHGEQGNQRKELEKLVDWLLDEVQPEVVHLSNSMMLGLARMIAERCGPPVVCSLSGEDIFLEKLVEPYYSQARQLLRERSADVDAFVALNNYYADEMSDYLDVPRERVHVIPHGLDLTGHGERVGQQDGKPQLVGYLARICEDKGLHLLIEACEQLAGRPDCPEFDLHAAGYLGKGDRDYLSGIERRVAAGPLAKRFHYHGELNREQKIQLLQSLDVFSTPTVYRESKGLPALEAQANGVPVVLPRHGSFPEMIEATGGGLLFEPLDTADLAEKLFEILSNPSLAADLGQQGKSGITGRHHVSFMAEQTLALYHKLAAERV